MASRSVASIGGGGQCKGLAACETTGAPILLRAFFKGSEVKMQCKFHWLLFMFHFFSVKATNKLVVFKLNFTIANRNDRQQHTVEERSRDVSVSTPNKRRGSHWRDGKYNSQGPFTPNVSILGVMQHQCWVCTNPLFLPMDDIGDSTLA